MASQGSSFAVLLILLYFSYCLANGHGRDKPDRKPPERESSVDRCSNDCSRKIDALASALDVVFDQFKEAVNQIKTKVLVDIPSQLANQSRALEEIKGSLSTVVEAQLQTQTVLREQLKTATNNVTALLGQWGLADERQTVAIGNMTSLLKRQEAELENLEESILEIANQGRNVIDELKAHDERLIEHDLEEEIQEKQVDDIHNALFAPRDCGDVGAAGQNTSDTYCIVTGQNPHMKAKVYCDFDTPGGVWLVFQRRNNGTIGFERTWKEYANGFGNPAEEFWLGNEVLHRLTTQRRYKLRIDLEDFEGEKRYAEYSQFTVASAAEFYRLTVAGYSGNAGDSFGPHSGYNFTTIDADNDAEPRKNCAQLYHGAWWYFYCHLSNLNGLYLSGPHESYQDGIEWKDWHGYQYSLKVTEMKIASLD